MGKLHQHLAVEDSKHTIFKNILEEAITSFSKREHLYNGITVKQESKLQEDNPEYAEYPDITETKPVADTVLEKLKYVADSASDYFDLVAEKDLANCSAKADLIIGNKVILKDVPAVTLLFIENKFKAIRNAIFQAKTLDQAKIWERSQANDNIYSTPGPIKAVKRTVPEYVIAVPSTDKHPAQVKETTKTEILAIRTATELCGYLPIMSKVKLLANCDSIIQAAKQARQTANDQEVVSNKISKNLFDFLFNIE